MSALERLRRFVEKGHLKEPTKPTEPSFVGFGSDVKRPISPEEGGEVGFVSFVGEQSNLIPPNQTDSNQPAHAPDFPKTLVHGADRTARTFSESEEERAAIIEFDGGAPREWAEALARLDPARPPSDIPPKRWVQFINDCGRFLDGGWVSKAKALGWGPFDLFGCDQCRPFSRIDHAGLLWLLNGRKLIALTADTATFEMPMGGRLTYRRQLVEANRTVLAWELALPRAGKNSA